LLLLDSSKSWWQVQNELQQRGYVPSNFVRRDKPSLFKTLKGTLRRKKNIDPKTVVQATNGDGAASGYQGRFSDDTLPYCDNVPKFAKFAYEAQQLDEMTLMKGEKVWVLEKSDDGWWRGRKETGQIGWFPSNYVAETLLGEDGHGISNVSQKTDLPGECIETVVALYAYSSSNSEELSFNKDETLEIVEKPLVDPEWWRARNQEGAFGLIPRNYVQTLSTDSGCPQITPESQSSSSLSGQSQGAGSSRTPSGGIRCHYNLSGPFADKVWYFGNITRQECEALLNQYAEDGDFLIRNSESNVGDYTVTLKASTPNRNKHFRVKCEGDMFTIGPQTFDTLEDLVEHYKRHPIYKNDREKLYLEKPFTHPSD